MSYDTKCWNETSTDVGHLRCNDFFLHFMDAWMKFEVCQLKEEQFYGFFMYNGWYATMTEDKLN